MSFHAQMLKIIYPYIPLAKLYLRISKKIE